MKTCRRILADAAYLPQGPAATLQLGPPASRVTETLTHDWQYRRTAQSVEGPGSTTLLDLVYAYDPAGNLTALTDNAGSRTAAYTYDDLGRLTGVTWADGARSWEYDAIGNVTRPSVDAGLPGEGEVDYAYQVSPSGKNTPVLATVAATSGGSPLWTSTLSTDPAGNITTDGASIYDYDLRNHLHDRQLPGVTSQHAFDASGRRVETTRSDTGTTTELEDPGAAGQAKREDDARRRLRERPELETEEFVGKVAEAIGIDIDKLRGRSKGRELTRARELIAVLGVERYGMRVKDLAEALDKHPVTVTGWVMRRVRRRTEDPQTAALLEALDLEACGEQKEND